MRDSLAPEVREVTRRKLGAAFVVGNETARVLPLDLRKHVDHRNVAGNRQLPALVGPARGDDDAIDPLAHELLDMARLADRVVRGVAHQDRHAAVRQALLYALHDGNGEPAERVGRNQADSQTLTAVQAVREVIGAESQLTRGGNDFLSRLAAKAAVVVERFRYRADAHIRRARDVPDGYAGATAAGLGLSRHCRPVRPVPLSSRQSPVVTSPRPQ